MNPVGVSPVISVVGVFLTGVETSSAATTLFKFKSGASLSWCELALPAPVAWNTSIHQILGFEPSLPSWIYGMRDPLARYTFQPSAEVAGGRFLIWPRHSNTAVPLPGTWLAARWLVLIQSTTYFYYC